MVTRVGINGFGRVGRAFTRYVLQRTDLEVMVINDITDAATLAHLLEFDSTYGRLHRVVGHTAGAITIDGRDIPVLGTLVPCHAPPVYHRVSVMTAQPYSRAASLSSRTVGGLSSGVDIPRWRRALSQPRRSMTIR